MKPNKLPQKGDKIYVPTSLYLSHGRDDFEGGLATIKSIQIGKGDMLEYNRVFVTIEERPDYGYNWNYLLENQKKWAKEYKGQIAHPDPDYSESSNEEW